MTGESAASGAMNGMPAAGLPGLRPPGGSRPRPQRSPARVMRDVVFALFLRELKTRLGGRWWGLVWLVGEPLLAAALMLALYSAARTPQVAGVDRLLFLVTGLLPFQLFKQLVVRSMEAIDANQALFAFRQVRPLDAVIARAALEASLAVLLALVVAAGLALYGHLPMPAAPLAWLAASALLAGFGAACGLFAAMATAGAWSRARALVRLSFLPLMLSSGVLVPISALPPSLRDVLALNPLLHLLDVLRQGWFGPSYAAVPGVSLALPLACTLVLVAVALALHRVRREALVPV